MVPSEQGAGSRESAPAGRRGALEQPSECADHLAASTADQPTCLHGDKKGPGTKPVSHAKKKFSTPLA